jgi:hypothetical protein
MLREKDNRLYDVWEREAKANAQARKQRRGKSKPVAHEKGGRL